MKKLVNGISYNTETSVRVAEQRWDGDDGPCFGTLYITRAGNYFVDLETTKQVWNQRTEQQEEQVTHEFQPMSSEQANKWMVDGTETEVFHDPWGVTGDDDGPESTLYIRIPTPFKRRIEEAAEAAGVSVNTLVTRQLAKAIVELVPGFGDADQGASHTSAPGPTKSVGRIADALEQIKSHAK
jgi:hypothetical protein